MVVCNFFLQGRCRFGEKCWNEHPRDGRHQAQNQYPQQSNRAAGSTSWSASSQKYVQPPSYPKSTTWTNRDNNKTSYGSFSSSSVGHRNVKPSASSGFFSQNHYSVLDSQDHAKDVHTDREGSILDEVLLDLDSWESSGQWPFSVYSVIKEKGLLSGFTDISPEEMRLECYSSQKEGNVQNYVNSVQQLATQWKRRILEIKNLSSASKLLNEITRPSPSVTPPTFGGQQSSNFGSSNFPVGNALQSASAFSFKQETLNNTPKPAESNFPTATAFGSKPATGFGNMTTADSFSFAKANTSNAGASAFSGFGSPPTGPNMFSSTVTTVNAGFGSSAITASIFGGSSNVSVFGSPAGASAVNATAALASTAAIASPALTPSLFGQVAGVSMNSTPSNAPASTFISGTVNALFTLQTDLSSEDLIQFSSNRFTLGKIPLLPPPLELLNV